MDSILEKMYLGLHTLTVFSDLMELPVPAAFQRLCGAVAENNFLEASRQYSGVYSLLLKSGTTDIGSHLLELLKLRDTVFSASAARGNIDPALKAAAKRDFDILARIPKICCRDIKRELKLIADGRDGDILDALPEWEAIQPMDFNELVSCYAENGSGLLSKHRAFIFTGGRLSPVLSPDPVRPEELIGYEWQRNAVIDNTRALLSGKRVNNILLYGDSGTGKSATVKALLGIDGFDMLRIIQIEKDSFSTLPSLIRDLAGRPQKFILFIDDLSFEDVDRSFSSFKVMLEGSLEARPDNTALYATSNRRQLVKRRFSDSDEMFEKETSEEKTSLADRFGISIPFLTQDRKAYLDMAVKLALRAGSQADSETLHREALKWGIEHGSATPRTARQFADFIIISENAPSGAV